MKIDEMLGLSVAPRMPKDRRRGIGIVGAGRIVNNAHLPAYRDAGFHVAAIYDARAEAARATAAEFDIPVVCATAEELSGRDDVAIVDIAITPEAQVPIAHQAIEAGKHVLCQKPLSENFADAASLVRKAESAGVLLAVNQQMRWSPALHLTRLLVERGAYGDLTECQFDIDLLSDWGWMGERTRVEYFYNSIHYLDAVRSLLGEPLRVLASSAQYPGQRAYAETRTFTILEYSETLRAVVLSNHNNWSGEPRAIVRCHGVAGRSEATLGMKDYPAAVADTFAFTSRLAAPSLTFHRQFKERWLPDSFAHPMADLMCAIEEKRAPQTSGRDNLGTLRIVHAAYRSIAEGRRVELSEFPEPAQ